MMTTKQEFKDALTERYEDMKSLYESAGYDADLWPYKFLSGDAFSFTTYDGDVDRNWSMSMLRVIHAILHRKTFEYITTDESYEDYLLMVNMPFMRRMLSWGGSIRGAWFDEYADPDLYSKQQHPECKYHVFSMCCGAVEVEAPYLPVFVEALLEWATENGAPYTPLT